MHPRRRFATFSLLLLLTACFLCWPLWATDRRTAAGALAESLAAHNSAGLSQAAQSGQAAGSQSPANDPGPLFPVVKDGKWGYIDRTGKIVIPLQYSDAYEFSEGLAAVWPGERQYDPAGGRPIIRLSFIDKTGRMVIPPQYPHAHAYSGDYGFSEGLAFVEVGGKMGFIDKTGQMVIPQKYVSGLRFPGFFEGLAAVQKGEKWGYIDKTGQMVIPPQYHSASKFSEGLASVEVGDKSDFKWGYIDKTGKYVWAPTK